MRARNAFTLVELLVVIGIIAVLIALLMPALSRARVQSQMAQTLSNLRQIGIAVTDYEQEFAGQPPSDLPDINQDGRAFSGLQLLAYHEHLPPQVFINPHTLDTVATKFDQVTGWPIFAEIGGTQVTVSTPTTIDSTNIGQVAFHCSFSYDHELKRSGRRFASRVYLGDRADYPHNRSFSNNWDGKGMCLLWNDQHGEFRTSKAIQDQGDPNIYHHNQYLDDSGKFPGEGATEVWDGLSVTTTTIDTHLRFFSEDEDNALLPNE